MTVSRRLELVHAGYKTDPVDKDVCCRGAMTILCNGCGCTPQQTKEIKRQERSGKMVYIRQIMSFFTLETIRINRTVTTPTLRVQI
jgi:hypothetical protein